MDHNVVVTPLKNYGLGSVHGEINVITADSDGPGVTRHDDIVVTSGDFDILSTRVDNVVLMGPP